MRITVILDYARDFAVLILSYNAAPAASRPRKKYDIFHARHFRRAATLRSHTLSSRKERAFDTSRERTSRLHVSPPGDRQERSQAGFQNTGTKLLPQ